MYFDSNDFMNKIQSKLKKTYSGVYQKNQYRQKYKKEKVIIKV